ncbi:hypothetical protein XBJ1_1359 [Xenorhabdus bovienii SS-2004]|uniref:Uncharacterized protein n=1 Tax=Xenorhabdus bovienii (strain SS-2004) TaxID=406818 RepID=D3UXW7_XENBS|nr:hypothetical protein XBJ1_1359 [Xenorhabdus bovienii SS-2004]
MRKEPQAENKGLANMTGDDLRVISFETVLLSTW